MTPTDPVPPAPALDALLAEVRACTACAGDLPLGPRPVLRAAAGARLLVIGQAPGTRVHATGIPWNDPSGDRLRDWLAMDRDTFYDANRIAIVPMGFCYPGRDERGGDKRPSTECAPRWHARLRAELPDIALTLLIGQYAQRFYLARRVQRSLTATVAAWRDYLPDFLPLPHPSWRTRGLASRNPWFQAEVIPALRERVHAVLIR